MVTARQPAGDGPPAGIAARRRLTLPASVARWTRWPLSGALLLAAGFVLALAAATLLLLAPAASTNGAGAADAFFTAVSALTLTGLAPVPTQEHWTLLGEGVIAAATLAGGLGYLAGATVALWLVGRRLGMRDTGLRRVFRGAPGVAEVLGVVRTVLAVALTVQAAGAIALFLVMLAADVPAERALWWGPFHAVSAFNNAGFALADGGYAAFADDLPVLAVTGALTLLGAIGPIPLALYAARRSFRRLPLDARVILLVMAGVFAAGAGALLIGEWSNPATLGGEPGWRRPFLALFESSARTAAFTTLDPVALREESKVLATGLLLIGGAAGSVSGGLKVGTIAVLATGLFNALAGRERLSLLGRELPPHAFRHALAITFLFGAAVTFLGAGMIASAHAAPLDALFEGVSAITLSGWSPGLSPGAGPAERGLLITAMLAGRFGPLLLMLQMARSRRASPVHHAEDSIRFG